jgi:hypothetical protein
MLVAVRDITWTQEPCLYNSLPKNITIEIDEELIPDDMEMEDYLLYAIGEESTIFNPVSIGSFKIVEKCYGL